jgi:hypothetical protein
VDRHSAAKHKAIPEEFGTSQFEINAEFAFYIIPKFAEK